MTIETWIYRQKLWDKLLIIEHHLWLFQTYLLRYISSTRVLHDLHSTLTCKSNHFTLPQTFLSVSKFQSDVNFTLDTCKPMLTHKTSFSFGGFRFIFAWVARGKALKRWEQQVWKPLFPSTELESSTSLYSISRRCLAFKVSEY